MSNVNELEIPAEAFDAEWATEIVRFWVVDSVDHISLRIGSVSNKEFDENEARTWGVILADIAKHAVNAIKQSDNTNVTRMQLYADIERGFSERLKEKTKFSGQLMGDGNAH